MAQVRRDGMTYTQRFRRGKPLGPVEPRRAGAGSGTTVTFTPDPEIFADIHYDPKEIADRLEVKTYLNKGLVIQFIDQKSKDTTSSATTAESPTSSRRSTRGGDDLRVSALPFVLEREDSDANSAVTCALAWTEATDEARPLVRQHDPDRGRRHARAGDARGRPVRRSNGS